MVGHYGAERCSTLTTQVSTQLFVKMSGSCDTFVGH